MFPAIDQLERAPTSRGRDLALLVFVKAALQVVGIAGVEIAVGEAAKDIHIVELIHISRGKSRRSRQQG
jgi:hypothetical protein